MKLNLNVEGIAIELEIKEYKKTKKDDNPIFCECSYSFTSKNWLNYSKKDDQIIACDEVDFLFEKLKELVNDELINDEEIEFWEPDFSFELITKKDLRKDKRYTYIAKGFEITDICLKWFVHFWDEDGALSENYLCITLAREDINKLIDYLEDITRINGYMH